MKMNLSEWDIESTPHERCLQQNNYLYLLNEDVYIPS
jgi:hypothetical protein